jgi:hypothetical protein
MQIQRDSAAVGISRSLVAVRWLLVVALVVAVILHAAMAIRELGVADQALSFYLINLAADLAPAMAYTAAVVLVVIKRGGRVAWTILLACGLAHGAVSLFSLVSAGFGELMLPPLCLIALSLSATPGRAQTARRATDDRVASRRDTMWRRAGSRNLRRVP